MASTTTATMATPELESRSPSIVKAEDSPLAAKFNLKDSSDDEIETKPAKIVEKVNASFAPFGSQLTFVEG
jgi:hypothetical protein